MRLDATMRVLVLIGVLTHAAGCVDTDSTHGGDSTPKAIVRSYHFSDTQELELAVPRPLVVNSPAWDANDLNPPVAARDAINAADQSLSSLASPIAKMKWRFEHAALFKSTASDLPGMERWFWIVAYYDANAVELEPMAQLEIVVLMDGRVITPTLVPARNYDEIEY
ncbi:MAG: hypothetical protein NXI28_21195 [bacterium]|nr:hypothetical protein [bacterium]